ncbi:glycoside hydrolase family 97 protein [Massilia endophytica]|uniref:glycoside hydrolase family 97 protein n=1 Tax=Massilia endophytica TaxID=2899220 RepID=UPI001E40922F|nr:glycoside hydrolase family 97 protein [Massilia endophytica]UGQ49078.1 glycoside hydrolase family 97 protein [Massilia endophytica]
MKAFFKRAALALALGASLPAYAALSSPDGRLSVDVTVSPQGEARYAVRRDGAEVLLPSPLGMKLEGMDLADRLSLGAASPVHAVRESYELATGKRRKNSYVANEQTWTLRNPQQQALDVTFRVSNDGVAFRYTVRGPQLKFLSEATGFAFAPSARAWLQPMAAAKTGFARTNPSYEEYWQKDIPAGTPSPMAGWVFPALFRSGDNWIALTEAGMDGSFHASRLAVRSEGGVYRIAGPAPEEARPGEALLAHAEGELVSPWRVMAIGGLDTLVNSTLGTDLAAPAARPAASWIKPGHASWSWAILKDDFTNYDTQKKFIDYAADMHWDYTLIDALWDQKIGYDKVRELAGYAKKKGIGILVWYNSAGSWNDTDMTPKDKLLTRESRVAEFKRLHEIGIKGIKVDFFGGDGQSMIAYYVDILKDAYDAQLLVNFHGATLPRGWSRTWPNLMTAEAIRGFEFATFDQSLQDPVAPHAAMIPFTRNLFDPMDFTPMVFGDIPNIRRTTRNGFELAESVLFVSGIQHFAEIPEGMATAPAYVKSFLRELPRSWDDSRFVDGFPGEYAVIARRAGKAWYVAGFNGSGSEMTLTLDLAFIGKRGKLITDGAGERSFIQSDIGAAKATRITIKPHGGFVATFK